MSSINDGIGDPRNHDLQGRVKKQVSGTREKARRMLRKLARDDADAAFLLDVLGLAESDAQHEHGMAP